MGSVALSIPEPTPDSYFKSKSQLKKPLLLIADLDLAGGNLGRQWN